MFTGEPGLQHLASHLPATSLTKRICSEKNLYRKYQANMKVRSSYGHQGKKNPTLMAEAIRPLQHISLPFLSRVAPVLSDLLKVKFL